MEPRTLFWYVHRPFPILIDLDNLEGEKRRLKREIEKLAERKDELLSEISYLRSLREKTAEEVPAPKVVRSNVSKMLKEKMEMLGNAEMNSLMAGDMYKAEVDALANAILNNP